MSRGGRGGYSYSGPRGSSYRGRGGSWSERGVNPRFSFSSRGSGGRFPSSSSSWGHNNSNSFDSRSRFNSSSNSHDRYATSTPRGRHDDSSYRRSYKSDGPGGYSSSRDNSTRSPDRKRMRTEAPNHRNHDGGGSYGRGGGSGDYNSRYNTSGQSYRGGGGERRSFNDDRRSSGGGAYRSSGRDDYRKPMNTSSGGPPIHSSPRRGILRGRGSLRTSRPVIRRRLVDPRAYLRRRTTLPLRSTSDYLRRYRIARIRSAAPRRIIPKHRKSSDKEIESDKEADNSDGEANETETKVKKETESEKQATTTPEVEKRASSVRTSPKKENDPKTETGSDKEDDKKSGASDGETKNADRTRIKRAFIRLTCIHCNMNCVTFREYSTHLFSGRHISAMRKVALKQKTVLARMRQAQRNAQREVEKTDDALAPRTIFCPLCKLNYRQLKAIHQMSEAHRNMKKFLMPYCRVCHVTFKSPMFYENHRCSLEHIKRKSQNEAMNGGDKADTDKEQESPTEEDGENFMTLDSVGDVDEDDEDGNKIPKSPKAADGESASKPKETINVGVEHVKKIEVYYCDLCNIYLPRQDDIEKLLRRHCRGRLHLQRYVRYKEDKDLRRQAERIHRKSQEAKEAKEKEKEKLKDKTEKPADVVKTEADKDEKSIAEESAAADDDGVDDKMWADVDKDLGEILAEVNTETGNKSSDEEDDSTAARERYDREPEFVVEFL